MCTIIDNRRSSVGRLSRSMCVSYRFENIHDDTEELCRGVVTKNTWIPEDYFSSSRSLLKIDFAWSAVSHNSNGLEYFQRLWSDKNKYESFNHERRTVNAVFLPNSTLFFPLSLSTTLLPFLTTFNWPFFIGTTQALHMYILEETTNPFIHIEYTVV